MTAAPAHHLNASGAGDTELGRYRVSSGSRLVVGRRTSSAGTEIVDLPLDGTGPTYLVDRGLHEPDAIAALVEDYLGQARSLDACPMSAEAIAAMLHLPDSDQLGTNAG